MKRQSGLIFFLCLFLVFGAFLTTALSSDEKVYKLRMQILFGPDMMWQYDPFIKHVKEASNGRLIIQPFSGGQLDRKSGG